ncbi:MAG: hypothetical protein ACI9DC_005177 [Gammaproteobacteria bacterium]|jgi:hypothetical protein
MSRSGVQVFGYLIRKLSVFRAPRAPQDQFDAFMLLNLGVQDLQDPYVALRERILKTPLAVSNVDCNSEGQPLRP